MTILSVVIGGVVLIAICVLCVMAGLLERGEVDREEDGAEAQKRVDEIVAATQPMALSEIEQVNEAYLRKEVRKVRGIS